jgi:dolichyl-phosphate-mannose-protein mannosyltransferase
LEKSSSTPGWHPQAQSINRRNGHRHLPRKKRELPLFALFLALYAAILLLHVPLLPLPFFWDEAGYFVPAARDLLLSGSFIPHSTVSNAHPPLIMMWLAAWWKICGFGIVVTRVAMLMVAAFALLGIFRLTERVANREVAWAATLLTAIYPVFFAQSSLAQLDMAAAGFIFWGLAAYLQERRFSLAAWFSLAALAKETAILAPLALATWELLCPLWREKTLAGENVCLFPRSSAARLCAILFPLLPLGAWYGYHYGKMGYVFGNPEYVRYNLAATLHPLRIAIAAIFRLWHVLGYMNLLVLTAAAGLAMMYAPVSDHRGDRPRIAISVQLVLGITIASYVAALSVVGGAELARYMLPVVPLVIILCTSTLYRRVKQWRVAIALVAVALAMGLFVNPPYGFSPEDNLAYSDFVLLHQEGERFISEHFENAQILTAWPASEELAKPYLGYVKKPVRVLQIENFSLPEILAIAEKKPDFDAALLFSTKYEPPHRIVDWPWWNRMKTRFFDYHRDLPPAAAAKILGVKLVFEEHRGGQWIAVASRDQDINVKANPRNLQGPSLTAPEQMAGMSFHH